jgi:hypothetical protein
MMRVIGGRIGSERVRKVGERSGGGGGGEEVREVFEDKGV